MFVDIDVYGGGSFVKIVWVKKKFNVFVMLEMNLVLIF